MAISPALAAGSTGSAAGSKALQCQADFTWVVKWTGSQSELQQVDLRTGRASRTIQFSQSAYYDAMSYNPMDGMLYAIQQPFNAGAPSDRKIVKINPSDGTVTHVATDPGMTAVSGSYRIGAMTSDGTTMYLRSYDSPKLVRVDLTNPTEASAWSTVDSTRYSTSDFAVNPVDGQLYGQTGSSLYRIDPNTGLTTVLGNITDPIWGDQVFDTDGNLYQIGSRGLAFKIDLTKKGSDGLAVKGAETPVFTGGDSRDYADAAGLVCPAAPGVPLVEPGIAAGAVAVGLLGAAGVYLRRRSGAQSA
ncbi:DUF6923 family protein [Streptomyces sp. IBSNAI002]|uniref:DUF6923 family protein n=1 Tax=Streptomyces sp. IBSNAI002 TaxID=3457500 RepID=UPI003FD210B4